MTRAATPLRTPARTLQPIPPGHAQAFASLGAALGVQLGKTATPQVGWLPWAVQPRTNGFHIARESAGGTQREFHMNAVRRVKVFRSQERAAEACAQLNTQGAAA